MAADWRVRTALICLILGISVMAGLGQTRKVSGDIGRHNIVLGTQADSAIAALSKDLRVQKVVNRDASDLTSRWIVFNGEGDPTGTLRAKDNAIVGVGFQLGPDLKTPQDMFDAIFDASRKISSLKAEERECEITSSTDYFSSAAATSTIIHYYCGRSDQEPLGVFRFEIRRSQGKGGEASFYLWGEIGLSFL